MLCVCLVLISFAVPTDQAFDALPEALRDYLLAPARVDLLIRILNVS